ncbi:MAG TPA: carboxymuconolactone decarboxylase family protein [Gemmatimonadaceae bacterium]|jgi:4-carboxymuconolactone decarboxylase
MEKDTLFTDSTRALVRIAAAVAGAPIAFTRRVMVEAIDAAPAIAVEEVLLQSYLFAGFPRALNAMRVWREVSGQRAPVADPDVKDAGPAELRRKGEQVCRAVYGHKYDALRLAVNQLHPALDAWMVMDGYGKVLSRPGLTLAERELCIVAACAASEQTPQLKSHLRGARNCGATIEDLAQTLSALTDIVTRDALSGAREELNRIKES